MTTILTVLTDDFVYLLSDRRLTDAVSGRPSLASDATKTVLFHDSLVFGFTGPAQLHAMNGTGLQNTAEWIAEVVKDCSGAPDAVSTLSARLSETYARHLSRMHPNARRLDVVAAGWGINTSNLLLVPISVKISNEGQSTEAEFVTEISGREQAATIMWHTYGVPFDKTANADLTRILRRMAQHETGGSQTILQALVWAFQRAAGRSSWVSKDVLATVLPRPHQVGSTRTYSIVGGGPSRVSATSLFVPEGRPVGRARQSFPVSVFPGGMLISEMSVTYDAPPRLPG